MPRPRSNPQPGMEIPSESSSAAQTAGETPPVSSAEAGAFSPADIPPVHGDNGGASPEQPGVITPAVGGDTSDTGSPPAGAAPSASGVGLESGAATELPNGTAGNLPANTGDNTSDTGSPPAPPAPPADGKKRLKCAALKGGKIIVGKGELVQIDKDGFFEIDAKEAARLLTIPGYEEDDQT